MERTDDCLTLLEFCERRYYKSHVKLTQLLQYRRAIAFLCGRHPRLGQNSILMQNVSADCMRDIVVSAFKTTGIGPPIDDSPWYTRLEKRTFYGTMTADYDIYDYQYQTKSNHISHLSRPGYYKISVSNTEITVTSHSRDHLPEHICICIRDRIVWVGKSCYDHDITKWEKQPEDPMILSLLKWIIKQDFDTLVKVIVDESGFSSEINKNK